MKATTLILSLIFISFSQVISAQSIKAGSYMERTFSSPMVGTSITYEFKGRAEIGGYAQRAMNVAGGESADGYQRTETEFYGAFFAYPLVYSEKASLKFNARAGLVNGENFLITPGLTASYSPYSVITLSGGVGVRSFLPTLMGQIQIRLTK